MARTRDLKLRRVTLTLASILVTGTLSFAAAQVQEESTGPVTKVKADEVPPSPDAVPDWYQRFSTEELDRALPAWSGGTENDVQLQLKSGRRWNLQLGITTQDGDRGLRREEMWAGATYNITSRLSIGGAVGVESDGFAIDGERANQQFEPGIRLQSAYKF